MRRPGGGPSGPGGSALFRYGLIQEVIDPQLSTRQRGPLVRALAAREHDGPVRGAGAGVAAHDRPVGPVVAGRRVRGAGAAPGPGHPADPGRGAGRWRRR